MTVEFRQVGLEAFLAAVDMGIPKARRQEFLAIHRGADIPKESQGVFLERAESCLDYSALSLHVQGSVKNALHVPFTNSLSLTVCIPPCNTSASNPYCLRIKTAAELRRPESQ